MGVSALAAGAIGYDGGMACYRERDLYYLAASDDLTNAGLNPRRVNEPVWRSQSGVVKGIVRAVAVTLRITIQPRSASADGAFCRFATLRRFDYLRAREKTRAVRTIT